MHISEQTQSLVSYSVAGCGAGIAQCIDAATGPAESLTILFACAVVFIRMLYDGTRFVRYLKKKKGKSDD